MQIITITSQSGSETQVAVVRETEKAILVKGNCSEAWFPKRAINDEGQIADWFRFDLVHTFLFQAPYAA